MTMYRLAFLLIAGLVGMRYYSAWCAFPLSDWNALRLTPSFMLRFGPTPYPGLEDGPVTTWIYGPVPMILNLPATLAASPAGALLVAAAINLCLIIVPVLICLRPVIAGDHRLGPGAWAALLCLALWPNNHLHYLQADNLAVAAGLVANAWLMQSGGTKLPALIGAAAATALAVWSKQTSIGLVAAQLVWLAWRTGPSNAVRYGTLCFAIGVALAGLFIARFGLEPLWLNLVTLPGRLPFWPTPLDRAAGLAPHLIGLVLLPAVALIGWHKAIFRRHSPWLLPALTWLFLIPAGLLSAFKVGGTANSLSSALYLLPAGALVLANWMEAGRFRRIAPAAAAAFVLTLQMVQNPVIAFKPLVAHLDRASFLAREFPGQIYFPWNPLITFYSEQRIYHAEDGLYVRLLGGQPVSDDNLRKELPPRWCVTVFRRADTGWGIIERLYPPNTQRAEFAEWTLYSWAPPP